jgi:hypothetical protein
LFNRLSKRRFWLIATLASVLALSACGEYPVAETTTPTLLPYPDTLDIVPVQEAMVNRINEIRADHGLGSLLWDESLQELAEGRAWGIVKGDIPFDEVDDSVATQLGEPVAELRTCLSESVTTPEAVAQAASEEWLINLDEVLLGHWERVGVGFDWGCPKNGTRGVVLVVLLAGEKTQVLTKSPALPIRLPRLSARPLVL